MIPPLENFTDGLATGERFIVTRYGAEEWQVIDTTTGKCHAHSASHVLCDAIACTFNYPAPKAGSSNSSSDDVPDEALNTLRIARSAHF